MKIESLIRISGGVLLNTPSIFSIEDIKISSSKVKRGDLFINVNNSNEEINEAVKNGAYAIITENIPKICDEEIAWITTDNLELLLIKLARYHSTLKNFRFIPLSKIQYSLSKSLNITKKAKLLDDEPQNALIQILNSSDETTFFVIDSSFITSINPTVCLPKKSIEADKIYENGLFYSSFIYKDKYIKDIKLSAFFIPYLCALMEYFDSLKIEYEIDNFNSFKHFYPQFVNSKFQKRDFGATGKVVIFEKDKELFEKMVLHVSKRVDKNSIKILDTNNEKTDIKEFKNLNFRYLLVNENREKFEEKFNSKENRQMGLF